MKVLDFGISKMGGPDGGLALTKTTAMLGSPLYMSPEQLKSSRNVDERADIWALGVILYELIAGVPPFMASTLPELGALVLSGDTPRLSRCSTDLPAGLSDIVATCLQRRAEDRFVNLADFAASIAPFGGVGAVASSITISRTLGGIPVQRAAIAHEHAAKPPLASVPDNLLRTQLMPAAARAAGPAFALATSVHDAGTSIGSRAGTTGPVGLPRARRAGSGALLGGMVLLTLVGVSLGLKSRALRSSSDHDQAGSDVARRTSSAPSAPAVEPTSANGAPPGREHQRRA